MSGFLSNLVARAMPTTPSIRPRLPSLYEAASSNIEPSPLEMTGEITAPKTDPTAPRTLPPTPSPSTRPSIREPANDLVPGQDSNPQEIGDPANEMMPTARRDDNGPMRRPISPPNLSVASPTWDPSNVPAAAPVPEVGPRPGHVEPQRSMSSPRVTAERPRRPQVFPVRSAAAAMDSGPASNAARSTSSQAPSREPSATSVEVTIGRVEVRAVMTPARTERPAASSGQSLETYLRRRSGASRA